MIRLPTPGRDAGRWAQLLNDYLLVAHNPDGTAKTKGRVRLSAAHFGAKGDGKTDDTKAIQAAIDAARDGGVVEIPRGTYMVRGLKIKRSGTTLTGEARWGTRLVRIGGTRPLIEVSGTGTMSGHIRYCTVTNLTLCGDKKPGTLLRSYYADSCTYRDVHFLHSMGLATDLVEVWDTRFSLNIWENCGNADAPAMLLRNSTARGEFGFSDDTTNQIHFISCRWEGFRNGAVKISGDAHGSERMLNGVFFTSCKMETSLAVGPVFQIMKNSTIIFVNQLYLAVMALGPGCEAPIDAIEDHGTHVFMTDVYVQWGAAANISNALVHIWEGGPHAYHKLSTFYPTEDPREASIVVEPAATSVTISAYAANRGRTTKGEVVSPLLSNSVQGMKMALSASGNFKITSKRTRKDLVRIHDEATYFADGKLQIENIKGYMGINTTPFVGARQAGIALLIRAAEGDRGVAIIRPQGPDSSAGHLLEFQDEANGIQGQAFDFHGRPIAVGSLARITAGDQVSYANPRVFARDVAGNATAAIRRGRTAPGSIAHVSFSLPFAEVPLTITITDHSVVASDLYVSERSTSGFTVSTRRALRSGSIVTFDYSVAA